MELKAMSRYFRFCAVACLAAFGLAASEHHGLVKSGNVPVPGATVTATKGDKKVVAITDDTGTYNFPDLEDGTWKLQVDMLCFTPVSKEIGIVPNAPGAEWELKLMSMDEIKPGIQAEPAPSAAPTGTAAAPATANAAAPGTPAPAAPAPPAKGKGKGAAATAPAQGSFQRADVNASADGAALANSNPGPPSIAGAEATQASSDAMVVNGSTSNGIERRAFGNGRKGPRSLYNGGIDFRNFDNDVWDARPYSLTGQDTPRSPYTRFTLGGQVQGPLYIPHLFRWTGNFYLQFQTTRNRTSNVQAYTVPTAAERAGDFSQVTNADGTPINLIDPTTGQSLPNRIIPQSEISPQAKYFLNYFPLPQFSTTGVNYNFQAPTISRSVANQFTARVNKPIQNKTHDSLNTIFTYSNGTGQTNNPIGFVDHSNTSNYRATATYNRNFNRTFYGQAKVDYTRPSTLATPFFAHVTNISGAAGINGNDQSPENWGPPSLGFQNFFGISDSNENFTRNQTAAVGVSFNYIRRPHQFQFGADYSIHDLSTVGQQNPRGAFQFNGQATGFDFADFLFGVPDVSTIAFGNADKYLKSDWYDLFLNDNWNVSSSFTFQWGVRWDYNAPITEKYGRLVNIDVSSGFAANAPVLAYAPIGSLSGTHYPDSLINPDKHQVSPRVSFAWKPIFGGSMVVRGGYGLYYNTSVYNQIAGRMEQQAPLSKSLSVTNSQSNPLTLANGFNAPVNQSVATFGVDPNYRIGYTHSWQASVQQNLTPSLLMTASYTGIKGTRLPQEFQPNTYPVGVVSPCLTCYGYTYLTSNGNSIRNAGTLNLRRRFHGGLSTTFNYTYSKSIDDTGGLGTAFGGIAQNWLDLRAERGLSTFDQRHNLQIALQYSTGVGVRGGALLNGWRGQIIKGWTMQSLIIMGTGLPLNPVYSAFATTGNQTLRPDYTGADIYSAPAGLFLNPKAFTAPPPGQYGNAGRDTITGPNQFSWNGTMARSFFEKYTVTFQATNILNHPTYTSWNTTVATNVNQLNQFGYPTAVTGMRTLSAVFRWTF